MDDTPVLQAPGQRRPPPYSKAERRRTGLWRGSPRSSPRQRGPAAEAEPHTHSNMASPTVPSVSAVAAQLSRRQTARRHNEHDLCTPHSSTREPHGTACSDVGGRITVEARTTSSGRNDLSSTGSSVSKAAERRFFVTTMSLASGRSSLTNCTPGVPSRRIWALRMPLNCRFVPETSG